MRRELPKVLLLAPGMEHGDAGLPTELEDRVVDVPLEDVEVLVGLHHALGQFLGRGDHPVAYAADVDVLLLNLLRRSCHSRPPYVVPVYGTWIQDLLS